MKSTYYYLSLKTLPLPQPLYHLTPQSQPATWKFWIEASMSFHRWIKNMSKYLSTRECICLQLGFKGHVSVEQTRNKDEWLSKLVLLSFQGNYPYTLNKDQFSYNVSRSILSSNFPSANQTSIAFAIPATYARGASSDIALTRRSCDISFVTSARPEATTLLS